MFNKSLFIVLGMTVMTLQACGSSQNAPAGSAQSSAAAPSGTSAATTDGAITNFDAVLKSSNTAAYISLADANGICQGQVQNLNNLTSQLQQQIAQGGNIQSAITQFNAALEALATCVSSQAQNANLPSIGQVTPGTSGSTSCSVSNINGQVTMTGDCSQCQVTNDAGSVSANCSQTGGATDSNTTTPVVAPNAGSSTGTTTQSTSCSVSVVNGTPTTTGDCSHCQVRNNGSSVSVSCSN